MIKYTIKNKQNIETNSWLSDFADASHYEPCFGKPERWVRHKDEPMAEGYDEADVLEERIVEDYPAIDPVLISEAIPGSPAVMDEAGNIVEAEIPEVPAVYSEAIPARTHREVKLRAEYQIEVVDITEAVALEKLSTEALRYLESTDWKVLRHIRQKALGITTSMSDEEYLEFELGRVEAANKVIR
jgi:hypothetical protein